MIWENLLPEKFRKTELKGELLSTFESFKKALDEIGQTISNRLRQKLNEAVYPKSVVLRIPDVSDEGALTKLFCVIPESLIEAEFWWILEQEYGNRILSCVVVEELTGRYCRVMLKPKGTGEMSDNKHRDAVIQQQIQNWQTVSSERANTLKIEAEARINSLKKEIRERIVQVIMLAAHRGSREVTIWRNGVFSPYEPEGCLKFLTKSDKSEQAEAFNEVLKEYLRNPNIASGNTANSTCYVVLRLVE